MEPTHAAEHAAIDAFEDANPRTCECGANENEAGVRIDPYTGLCGDCAAEAEQGEQVRRTTHATVAAESGDFLGRQLRAAVMLLPPGKRGPLEAAR